MNIKKDSIPKEYQDLCINNLDSEAIHNRAQHYAYSIAEAYSYLKKKIEQDKQQTRNELKETVKIIVNLKKITKEKRTKTVKDLIQEKTNEKKELSSAIRIQKRRAYLLNKIFLDEFIKHKRIEDEFDPKKLTISSKTNDDKKSELTFDKKQIEYIG